MNSLLILLERVLDDDDRTRRANLLLRHINLWLVIVVAALLGAVIISAHASGWVPLAVVSATAFGTFARRQIQRRRERRRRQDAQLNAGSMKPERRVMGPASIMRSIPLGRDPLAIAGKRCRLGQEKARRRKSMEFGIHMFRTGSQACQYQFQIITGTGTTRVVLIHCRRRDQTGTRRCSSSRPHFCHTVCRPGSDRKHVAPPASRSIRMTPHQQ
jgi:hypothetical protein